MKLFFFLWVIQGFAAYNLTWGTPAINLDSNPPAGDTDENVTMAMDAMGNAVATWGRTSGNKATGDIWATQYNHNQRVWSATVKISGGGNAFNSQVIMNSAGDSLFIWEEGFPTQIMSRTLTAQGVWIPDLEANPIALLDSPFEQTTPYIAQDEAGNILAIWMEWTGGASQIYAARKKGDASWEDLGRISSSTGHAKLSGTKPLSMNPNGEAVAVWEEDGAIFAATFKQNKWSAEMQIASGTQNQFPSVAIDLSGNGVIVWEQNGVIQSKIVANCEISTQTKQISEPAFDSTHPDLGIDEKGNAIVVYERINSLHKFITSATLQFGANAWSTPVDISTPSPKENAIAGFPVLSINPIGDAVAIWKEHNGENMIIQGAGYSLGTWSLHKTLSSIHNHSGSFAPSYDIAVAINSAGNIMAIWPEDCSKVGALQVKATSGIVQLKSTSGVGLANLGPMPPSIAKETIQSGVVFGKQVLHRFPAHSDLINILTWEATAGVAYYKIYRGNLSSLIGTTNKPYYEDHKRSRKKLETYLITSVDDFEQESSPMTIVVYPKT